MKSFLAARLQRKKKKKASFYLNHHLRIVYSQDSVQCVWDTKHEIVLHFQKSALEHF